MSDSYIRGKQAGVEEVLIYVRSVPVSDVLLLLKQLHESLQYLRANFLGGEREREDDLQFLIGWTHGGIQAIFEHVSSLNAAVGPVNL